MLFHMCQAPRSSPLAISERIALSDLSNTIWLHDLAVSYANIASVSIHPGPDAENRHVGFVDAVAAPPKHAQ